MTALFIVLVLAGIATMAWSFLSAQKLESSVSELEERMARKVSQLQEKN